MVRKPAEGDYIGHLRAEALMEMARIFQVTPCFVKSALHNEPGLLGTSEDCMLFYLHVLPTVVIAIASGLGNVKVHLKCD